MNRVSTTPTLTVLAESSFVFDTAISTGPYTPEAVPGFLAGLHGYNSAYYSDMDWTAIPDDAETIASYLGESGWETIATITNPQLTTERNFDKGFETFRNLRTENTQPQTDRSHESTEPVRERLNDLFGSLRNRTRAVDGINPFLGLYVLYRYRQIQGDWPTIHGEYVIDALADTLDSRDCDRPFFAWTHLMDLHAPLHPETIRAGGLAWSDSTVRHLFADAGRMANRHTPAYETMYDSALRYVDDQIARLIEYLQQHELWDETILVVTADHGEALFERGVYGHQYHNMFDELLHVPLLVRTPEETSRRFDTPFSLGWLHELLTDLVGIDHGPLAATSGRSSHLDDGTSSRVVSDSVSHRGHTVAVRTAEYTFIKHFGELLYREHKLSSAVEPFNDDGAGYHNYSDPSEHCPLAPEKIPHELRELAESVRVDPAEIPSLEGELDTAARERLHDLGYVE